MMTLLLKTDGIRPCLSRFRLQHLSEDDGQGMPDLTPITPFSAGLYTGQGHGAYDHGAPPVSFSVERHADCGF